MHKMKVNWKVGHEVEGCNVIFHKWKGIWISKEESTKENMIVLKDEDEEDEKVEKS
jgi:hypothetical protein